MRDILPGYHLNWLASGYEQLTIAARCILTNNGGSEPRYFRQQRRELKSLLILSSEPFDNPGNLY